jgi:hypothetical protein
MGTSCVLMESSLVTSYDRCDIRFIPLAEWRPTWAMDAVT